jgi:hypothetical protein
LAKVLLNNTDAGGHLKYKEKDAGGHLKFKEEDTCGGFWWEAEAALKKWATETRSRNTVAGPVASRHIN